MAEKEVEKEMTLSINLKDEEIDAFLMHITASFRNFERTIRFSLGNNVSPSMLLSIAQTFKRIFEVALKTVPFLQVADIEDDRKKFVEETITFLSKVEIKLIEFINREADNVLNTFKGEKDDNVPTIH